MEVSSASVRLRLQFLVSAKLPYLPVCFPQVAGSAVVVSYPPNTKNQQAAVDSTRQCGVYHPDTLRLQSSILPRL